jgi:hypothetical protein
MNEEAGKSIVQLDENGTIIKEFSFMYEAGKYFGVSEHTVRRYLRGIGIPKKLSITLKYKKDI